MLKVGDSVRVLFAFSETYPDVYQVTEVIDDNTFVLGDIGAFDLAYLEPVA